MNIKAQIGNQEPWQPSSHLTYSHLYLFRLGNKDSNFLSDLAFLFPKRYSRRTTNKQSPRQTQLFIFYAYPKYNIKLFWQYSSLHNLSITRLLLFIENLSLNLSLNLSESGTPFVPSDFQRTSSIQRTSNIACQKPSVSANITLPIHHSKFPTSISTSHSDRFT